MREAALPLSQSLSAQPLDDDIGGSCCAVNSASCRKLVPNSHVAARPGFRDFGASSYGPSGSQKQIWQVSAVGAGTRPLTGRHLISLPV